MAVRKSDLYAFLRASCDELRGGMDASQYKDYVLFIKYISDKYGNSSDFAPPVVIPKVASFTKKIALKGTIRLNTELVKKPMDLLEYVVAHEMVHLLEPTHSEGFVALSGRHCPSWRVAQAELNKLPLGAQRSRE